MAYVPNILWETQLHGENDVSFGGIVSASLDATGDVLVASYEEGAGHDDCSALLKVSGVDGHTVWRVKRCGLIDYGMALDAQGNLVTTGTSGSGAVAASRIAKYAGTDGSLLWERLSPDGLQGSGITIDKAGNVLAVLTSNAGASLVKLSAAGARLWSVEAGYSAYALDTDSHGDVFVSGRMGTNNSAVWSVTKFAASDGSVLWRRVRDEPNSRPYAIAVDASGNVVATGAVPFESSGHIDSVVTMKFAASDGALRWERVHTTPGEDSGYSVAVNAQGDVAIAGTLNGDVFTARYRGTDGATQWSATYDGPRSQQDYGAHVAFDSAGDVVVVATVNVSDSLYPNSDIRTLKYAGADGALLWSYGVSSHVHFSFDRAHAAVPARDGVIVLGDFDWGSGVYLAKYGDQRLDPLNAQGLWWASPAGSESGWGLNMTHQGEIIFLTWFTYDDDGTPAWFVMPRLRNIERNIYLGSVYRTTGPAFSTLPFPSTLVNATIVGTGFIELTGADTGRLAVGLANSGQTINKTLVRQAYGPLPECRLGLAPGANYQDLWWADPPGSESGWGMNIAHEGDVLFVTWFTYGTSGRAMWYVGTFTKDGEGRYSATLYRTTGTSYRSQAWDASRVSATAVGSATLTFAAPSRAVFSYTVDGISQSKPITRESFAAPATACR